MAKSINYDIRVGVIGDAQLNKFQKSLDRINRSSKKTAKSIGLMSKSMTSMNAVAKSAATSMQLFVVALASREVINTLTQFEDLRTTLSTVEGSVDAGAAAFDNLNDLVQQTPFQIDALTNSFVKLRAAGLEATNEQLMLFSDIASVTTDRIGTLNAMTDLFARTTAGGLGLEDLNRLADRGIPVFTILEEKLGLARLEISKVGKTAEGTAVILEALSEGLEEKFGGASETAVNNLSVAISNLGGQARTTLDEIVNGLGNGTGGLADAVNVVSRIIQRLGEMAQEDIKNIQEIWEWMTGAFNDFRAILLDLESDFNYAMASMLNAGLVMIEKLVSGLDSLANGLLTPVNIIREFEGLAPIVSDFASGGFIDLKLAIESLDRAGEEAGLAALEMAVGFDAANYAQQNFSATTREAAAATTDFSDRLDKLDTSGKGGGAKKAAKELEAFLKAIKATSDPLETANNKMEALKTTFESLKLSGLIKPDDIKIIEAYNAKIAEMQGEFVDLQNEANGVNEAMDTIEGGMSTAFGEIIDGSKSAKDAFSDMAISILNSIAQMALEILVIKPLMDSLKSSFGSIGGGGFSFFGLPPEPTGVATATVPTQAYGVGRTPTASMSASIMKSATLSRSSSGSGINTIASPVNVNITNNSKNEVEVAETIGNDGSRTLEVLIEGKVKDAFSSGRMDKSMKMNYGVRRVGS